MSKKNIAIVQPYSEITDAQFKKWEAEHGKLKIINVPLMDEDEDDYDPEAVAKFVLKRNPRPGVIKAIKRAASQTPPNLEKVEALAKNEVLLGGDLQFIDEESKEYQHGIYMAVDNAIGDITKGKTSRLGKR